MKVTVRFVLEQAAGGYGPEFGAPVPNPTTFEAIDAARRGAVIKFSTPAEAIAELNWDG